ncbi:hypothetical protein K458DRAFT_411304 [Lentithecium fluviatile CBS 122367]|uniref:Uncharacterized protein n=1 Tax=Lentithecium fluviatile CBS 122367 TaxID=1168545 RepID=A0A6G1JN77_9PLEO|nr:hypothetical protein K458DRAFT_411304 [Lentithecium fluviatile CBS 122367]
MGIANPTADPANVVQALVYTLLDVFDASRDLYQTLRAKEKRDYQQNLRSRRHSSGRLANYVDDEDAGGDESIVIDKAAVTRRFEIGFQDVGAQYAIGDVITQTALQSQIITLQSVIITTFLYGPTSPDPISHHLSSLVAASRAAGAAAVDALAAQQQRQVAALPPTPRSRRTPSIRGGDAKALPYPVTSASSTATALVKSRHEHEDNDARPYPANTTIYSRPTVQRSDTESTSFSGPTSYGTESTPHTLFCLYALDLQRHRSQPLSASITSDPSPYCPYCKRTLSLSPGKSWEVCKDDEGVERYFRIQNRFVVKCHRNSVDGGYSCVLCSRGASVDTVCGDVKALIRHIWMDHDVGELELEEDVFEVVDKTTERRRDSVVGSGYGSGSRRSVSLGPSRGNGRRRYDREVETLEMRSPRREA